jgi:hypothetical protein
VLLTGGGLLWLRSTCVQGPAGSGCDRSYKLRASCHRWLQPRVCKGLGSCSTAGQPHLIGQGLGALAPGALSLLDVPWLQAVEGLLGMACRGRLGALGPLSLGFQSHTPAVTASARLRLHHRHPAVPGPCSAVLESQQCCASGHSQRQVNGSGSTVTAWSKHHGTKESSMHKCFS